LSNLVDSRIEFPREHEFGPTVDESW
jgi:hypothetical protein